MEQIKIKGSGLARCPHMPAAAVTVNHGSAASMLIVANIYPLPPAKGHPSPFTAWERLRGMGCVSLSRHSEADFFFLSLPLGGGYGEQVRVQQVSPEAKIDVVKSGSP